MPPVSFIADEPQLLRLTAGGERAEARFEVSQNQAGSRAWTDADSLVVDILHDGSIALPVRLAFGTPSDSHTPAVSATYGVLPGVRTRLVFPLTALNAETVFLPRTPGRLKATLFGRPTRPAEVNWLSVGVGNVGAALTVTLSHLTLTDDPQPLIPSGPILVDELGQWAAHDWPGKTPDVPTLVSRLRSVEASPSPVPSRNLYGGSTEITFEATGAFRTHHDGRRWWLVDPLGGAFWSAGADCVDPGNACRVAGNEALCAWLPPHDGEFAEAWQGQDFSWPIANLVRAFGSDWRAAWGRLTRQALVDSGFNTVGNWSNTDFSRASGLPYVHPLENFPTTHTTVFRDFPDVFSPEYASNAEAFAAQLVRFRDDPFLIGYFLRNEPLWAFGVFRLAEEMLRHDPARAPFCRRELVTFLRDAYKNTPHRWEADWGGAAQHIGDIEHLILADPAALSEQAREILGGFSRRMIDAYVRIPSSACRRVDPHHLNLGMRWAWIATDDQLAGSDACDVFSLNTYDMAVDPATVRKAAEASGCPVMIGEFHFGATDRGLPSNGLRGVATQADRGQAYRYFIEQAAALPEVVGAHYFQWNDQPLLGRFDGENWQIGIIDVCHTPYPEFAAAAHETHRRLYAVASGQTPPLSSPPVEVPKLGF